MTWPAKYGNDIKDRAARGVAHAGSLWRESDGTEKDFHDFCLNRFIAGDEERLSTFQKGIGLLRSHVRTLQPAGPRPEEEPR